LTARIQAALDELGQSFPDGTAARLGALLDALERWNRKLNLTAIRDADEMIRSHLLDSLVTAPLLEGKTVLDVGTGAGFPGLPLALVQPERQFTLLDSNNKKIMFVQHAAGLLGLDNVTVVKARGEDYAPGHGFDTVIARALAALPRLVEIAGHHVREDGVFVALKGRYPTDELEQLELPWRHAVTELDVPGLEKGSRHAVLLRRHVQRAGLNDTNHSGS
jgi:16S rRNA (guanine527-N7)-methyltransferase